jgi:hypothetical protein
MAERKRSAEPPSPPEPGRAAPPLSESAPAAESARPVVPPEIEEHFLPVAGAAGSRGKLVYRPAALGVATLHYVKAGTEIDLWRSVALLAAAGGEEASGMPWEGARVLEGGAPSLEDEPEENAQFAALPPAAARPASYPRWSKMLRTHLYRSFPLRVWRCDDPRAISRPGQSEGEFRAQLRQLLREKRDLELEKLRKRYAPKLARMTERIRKAEQKIERERSQYRQQKMRTVVSIGATVLGALFGRKLGSVGNVGRATTAARGASRAAREREDVARARDDAEALRQQLEQLEAEFEEQLAAVRERLGGEELVYQELPVRPRKSDLAVERVALVWTPWRVGAEGIAEPDF